MAVIDRIAFSPKTAGVAINLQHYGYRAGDVVYVYLKGDFDPDGPLGVRGDTARPVNFVYGDLDIPIGGRDYVRVALQDGLVVSLINKDKFLNDNTDPDRDFHIELAPGLFTANDNRVFFNVLTRKQAQAIARGEPFMDAQGGDDQIILPGRANADFGPVRWNPNVVFKGNAGNDTISGYDFADRISGGDGVDTLLGGQGNDGLRGDRGIDRLDGEGGHDQLRGGAGDDFLSGGFGNDWLYSDAGHEQIDGGRGRDTFYFSEIALAGTAPVDTITDFTTGQDRINLAAIDANGRTRDGDTAFDFIGAQRFHKVAGELRAIGGVVSGDVDGDGRADFFIRVINRPDAIEADFVL